MQGKKLKNYKKWNYMENWMSPQSANLFLLRRCIVAIRVVSRVVLNRYEKN